MIATVGIAAASVSFASAWYCTRRWNSRTPPTTISRATTRKKTVKSGLLFVAGFHRGFAGGLTLNHLLSCEGNHQNAVGRRHAHAHDGPCQRRHVQRSVRD